MRQKERVVIDQYCVRRPAASKRRDAAGSSIVRTGDGVGASVGSRRGSLPAAPRGSEAAYENRNLAYAMAKMARPNATQMRRFTASTPESGTYREFLSAIGQYSVS